MSRILIVEDDSRIVDLLTDLLEEEKFSVASVGDGKSAVDAITRDPPDLVLLDMMLPGMDGMEVCQHVRPTFERPILMLTANSDDATEAGALDSGIDDYLSKPVRPRVLLARIRSLLRRGNQPPGSANVLDIQDLHLDNTNRVVLRGGLVLELSDSEFDLLWYLASRAGTVVSRDELLSCLRGIEFDGLNRSVDMRVSKLRKRLLDHQTPHRYIRTVRYRGYAFQRDAPL